MSALENYSDRPRNPRALGDISRGEPIPRLSEPELTVTTPHPPRGAQVPRKPVPSRGVEGHDPRRCRRCCNDKPAYTFLHMDERAWATRYFCGDCLVERGHVRAGVLASAHKLESTPAPLPPVLLARAHRERVARRIRAHHYTVALLDQAMAQSDPAFGDALVRASELVYVQRAGFPDA